MEQYTSENTNMPKTSYTLRGFRIFGGARSRVGHIAPQARSIHPGV